MDKKIQVRKRRGARARHKIRELGEIRLSIHRTPMHTYAQVIAPCGSKVLASASTLDKETRKELKHGGNIDAAKFIGKLVAERAVKAGVTKVAFDRSGFKYHGRVQALADAARESGLQF
jgi:large subunit ribosomal protein L18